MMRKFLHNVKNFVDIVAAILSDNLEGSKQFGSQELSLFITSEVSKGNKDSSGLE